MSIKSEKLLSILAAVVLLAASFRLGEAQSQQADMTPPVVYATGSQVSVYYPAEKKLYVYTQLGGNCVYAYTLTTPGGALERENCK